MKKKMSFGKVAFAAAKLVNAVEKAVELKMIQFIDNDCHLYPELLMSTKDKKVYIKNLRYYAVLKGVIKDHETLFVKNIETAETLGFCKAKSEATCYL